MHHCSTAGTTKILDVLVVVGGGGAPSQLLRAYFTGDNGQAAAAAAALNSTNRWCRVSSRLAVARCGPMLFSWV